MKSSTCPACQWWWYKVRLRTIQTEIEQTVFYSHLILLNSNRNSGPSSRMEREHASTDGYAVVLVCARARHSEQRALIVLSQRSVCIEFAGTVLSDRESALDYNQRRLGVYG